MDPINGQTPPERHERAIPEAWKENPFQAPSAPVEDAFDANAELGLASSPRSVSFSRGAGWIGAGWSLFRESMGLWIGIFIVFMLIQMGVGLIPILGGLVNIFLSLTLSAGLMIGAHSLDVGEELRFDHLFAGFQRNFGQLLLVGLLYLVGTIIIIVLVVVICGGALFAAFMDQPGAAMSGLAPMSILLAVLVALALSVGSLIRSMSGKSGERQIEPTQIAALRDAIAELQTTLNAYNRELGEGRVIAVQNQQAVRDLERKQDEDAQNLHEKINAVALRVEKTDARLDGIERTCRIQHQPR